MGDLLGRAAELERAGRPYVMATVVAIERPTSARPGASGLVYPDGTIEGWVGGSCAQPVVVREALRSLVDGEPRLIRLSKTGGEGRRGDGVIEYVMTCHSGGTLEIFVQPHLPPAELWVIGATPIAQALARAGVAAGYHVSVVDPVADPEVFGEGIDVHADMDLAGAGARLAAVRRWWPRRAAGTRRPWRPCLAATWPTWASSPARRARRPCAPTCTTPA